MFRSSGPVAPQSDPVPGFAGLADCRPTVGHAIEIKRGYDVMVACQLPKLIARVRFPLPAPALTTTQPRPGEACDAPRSRRFPPGRNNHPAWQGTRDGQSGRMTVLSRPDVSPDCRPERNFIRPGAFGRHVEEHRHLPSGAAVRRHRLPCLIPGDTERGDIGLPCLFARFPKLPPDAPFRWLRFPGRMSRRSARGVAKPERFRQFGDRTLRIRFRQQPDRSDRHRIGVRRAPAHRGSRHARPERTACRVHLHRTEEPGITANAARQLRPARPDRRG